MGLELRDIHHRHRGPVRSGERLPLAVEEEMENTLRAAWLLLLVLAVVLVYSFLVSSAERLP